MAHENGTRGVDLGAAPDLGDVEDQGTEVEIIDLNGEVMYWGENADRPVKIRVAGTYSNRYRRMEQAQNTRRIKRRVTSIDGAALAKDKRELVAACVLDWDGFFDAGEPLECTRQNVTRVFEALPYVQEQVEQAMADHESFFKTSSTD